MRPLLLAFLLVGCVSVGVTPDLPMPKFPSVQFVQSGQVCLSEPDANDLRVYFDELTAYREALQRFHKKDTP